MPTATLLRPRSMRKNGNRYLKGVPTPINLNEVPDFKMDEHFEVDTSDVTPAEIQTAVLASADEKKDPTRKPLDPDAVYTAIQKAYQGLDVDDATNFLKDGRPDARVLSRILGYTVSATERDAALGYDDDEPAEKKTVKIKKASSDEDGVSV